MTEIVIRRLVQLEGLNNSACARFIFSDGSSSEIFATHEGGYMAIRLARETDKITSYEAELLVYTLKGFRFRAVPVEQESPAAVLTVFPVPGDPPTPDWAKECGGTLH